MAQAIATKKPLPSTRVAEFLGLVSFALALMLLISLATYDPRDPAPFFKTGIEGPAHNFIGPFGAFLAELLIPQLFGMAAMLLPLALGVAGWKLFWCKPIGAPYTKASGIGLLLAALTAFCALTFGTITLEGEPVRAGGAVGEILADLLLGSFNRTGAYIVVATCLFVSLILATQFSFAAVLIGLGNMISARWRALSTAWAHYTETRRKERMRREVLRKHAEKEKPKPEESTGVSLPRIRKVAREAEAEADAAGAVEPEGGDRLVTDGLLDLPLRPGAGSALTLAAPTNGRSVHLGAPGPSELGEEPEDADASVDADAWVDDDADASVHADASDDDDVEGDEPGSSITVREADAAAAAPLLTGENEPGAGGAKARRQARRQATRRKVAKLKPAEVRNGFPLPPTELLDDIPRISGDAHSRLYERGRILEAKCHEFGVMGRVTEVQPGPVVTTYEFKPDAGIKYSKVVGLADDLALALEAESIRIDRISGKSTVGIEIPNEVRETISLREILASETFRRAPGRLTVALGKTVGGEAAVSDLTAMPHLLIAGATGTGKSVGLNCIISSILFNTTPAECRLILIDPKRLELGVYEDIPHLLTPVVTDPKIAANVLKWAVTEMERRIRTLASEGVRNIDQFNNIVRSQSEEREEGAAPLEPLHYIVIVIDELADLMMVSSNEVEEAITRLAQMARAVGIHLILATQRPSVDVLTGLIKANMPSRISFRVSARVDSRTILDTIGADKLLGKGDMLFLPPGSARLVRIHGAYISEKEVARLSAFLREAGEPVYDDSVGKQEKAQSAIEADDRDELFDEAVRFVVQSGQASTSMLQRRFRIGFSRAGRLIDMMERDGIIGPADGSKPREIKVAADYYEQVDAWQR